MATAYGVEAHVIGREEAAARYPLMRIDDLVGAVWIPGDGKANPADITQALARGARAGGARLMEGVKVTGVNVVRGAVAGVETSAGPIATEILVNCAGMWARELGRLSGVTIPLHACEHMYIVTQPIAGVAPDLPVLRDPDGHIYVKEEVGGLLMGGFDPWAKPWGAEGIPEGFSFGTLPEDWDKFDVLMRNALVRLPALETAPVRTFLNGPESFTPDNYFILGEAPRCAATTWAPASARAASPPRAGRGRRSPSGSSRTARPWISGRPISGASRRSTATAASCASGSARSWACTTTWPSRTAS
jgi:4-methylaminobutanoate oxidase (formaldehyde-forming)